MLPHDPGRKSAGSVELGIVFPGVLLVASLVSRHPLVAERIWRRLGTYPDITACREAVARAAWPLRAWAGSLLELAEAAAWAAKAALSHEGSVSAFVKAQSLVTGSRLVLELPSFLLLAAGGLALGRIIARSERPPALDLAERLVLLDTSNLGPPTFELPELDLPFPPAVAPKVGWPDEDIEELGRLKDVAARRGVSCREISQALAALPVARASRMRAALRVEAGMSDLDLAAYRKGRLLRPRHWHLRRLRRAGVSARFLEAREALRRIGGLTPLRERLLRIAAAHAAWPASIDHHGAAEGGLLDHRASVLLETIDLVRAGTFSPEDREALLTAAAAHDGGKWISFGIAGGRWIRYDGLHAERTADILRSLPELATEHGDDTERIALALQHEHEPENVAADFRSACRRLVKPLKSVERAVVSSEEAANGTIERAVEEVIHVLPRMVSEMSINRATGEWQAHGFYEGQSERGDEVLLVLEAALRHQLRDYLGQPAQRALGLWRDRRAGELHPGFAAIARGLLEVGAMPRSVRKTPVTAEMPLVSFRSGKKIFRGAFPISLAWLASKTEPESLVHLKDGWGARGWDITILGQGVNVPTTPPAVQPAPPLPPPLAAAPTPPEEAKPEPAAETPTAPPTRPEPPAAGVPSSPPPTRAPKERTTMRCLACGRRMRLVNKGRLLVCDGESEDLCHAKLPVRDGRVVTTCSRCGRRLVPVRPARRPAFMACADSSCRRKPPSSGDGTREAGPDA